MRGTTCRRSFGPQLPYLAHQAVAYLYLHQRTSVHDIANNHLEAITMPQNRPIYVRPLIDREIRLIRLLPDSFDAPIRCELFEASLDNAELQYQAISYAWGDAAITQCIECNGLDVDVTVSLGTALRAFRHSEDARIVWADALCINQEDPEERGRQVSMMGDVYRSASKVLVWLGVNEVNDEDAIRTAFQAMEYVTRLCPRIPNATDPEACSTQNLVDAFVAQGVDDVFASFEVFYNRPYWKRTWCIQELWLAREVEVWLGRHMVSGAVSGTFTWWLQRKVARHPDQFPRHVSAWMTTSATQLFRHSEGIQAKAVDMRSEKIAQDFLQLLLVFQNQQVTDKRDKIYGLLGIADACEMTRAIEVDYNRPYEAMIQDFVKDTIRQRGDLGVLAYVDRTAQDGNTPSWIPRWDLGLAKASFNETVYYAGLPLYEKMGKVEFPSGALDVNPVWFAKQDILELPGVVFDHVGEIGQQMKPTANFSELYRYLDTDLVAKSWFTAISRKLREEVASAGLDEPPQEAVFHLATTFTGGATSIDGGVVYTHLEQLHPLTEIGDQYMRHFTAFAKRRPDPERPEIDGREFNLMAARACMNHRFIVTSKGIFGLARGGVMVGDIVAVLHGGYYPFILRKSEGATDGYTLIGGKILCHSTVVCVLMCSRMLCLQHRQGRCERDASARRSQGNVIQTGMTLNLSRHGARRIQCSESNKINE
jgi:hypothetical protein